jgi:UDP-GlcNAc:undecaprenyl-phosphate GlcNAc-1-phosphate transferase
MLFFIISFFCALVITPIVIFWYRKKGWVEDPQQKKHVKITHEKPVPRGGGVVIFLTLLCISLLFLHLDKYVIAILSSCLLLAIAGFLDDIFDIHPVIRLGVGLIAALIVVGSGIGIAYITNPFGSGVIRLDSLILTFKLFGTTHSIWVFSDLLAIFFIVWNMNIVNWSKGVDGQMPGFVAIALVFISILAAKFGDDPSQFNTQTLALISAGAFAGFLIWNMYPQKIMPGYGAGSLAGFLLAVLSILSGAKIATTIMVLAVPTADAIFTISRRLLAGKSPFWGDRGHLHHKLMDVLGWGRRRIAIFYWLTTLILGVLSLYLSSLGKFVTFGLVTIFVFLFLIWAKLQTSRNAKAV